MNTTANTAEHETAIESVGRRSHYVRAGVAAGLVAAALNMVVVALADAGDVSLTVDDSGRPIPLVGFAQVTLVCALIGIAIAAVLRRLSARPVTWFTRITVALTTVSLILPMLVDAEAATRVLLIATHLIAAAIIIPVIAKRLAR